MKKLVPIFKRINTFYPKLMIPELIAKISKELVREQLQAYRTVEEAFESLLGEVDIQLIEPNVNHVLGAINIRIKGHKDIFDCIAYATALEENAKFLTIDYEFIKFLEKHNYDTSIIWNHSELIKAVSR